MPELTPELLREYINRNDGSYENECGKFINLVAHLLVPNYTSVVTQIIKREVTGTKGRVDVIIIVELNEGGSTENKAYIWELKAPQKIIFRKDRKHPERLVPSSALIDAENQLLYYYDERRRDGNFIGDYGLGYAENVCLGGIIISRKDKLVSVLIPEGDRERLFINAKRVRNILYNNQIRIRIWDDILEWYEALFEEPITETPEVEPLPIVESGQGAVIHKISESEK